MGTIFKGVLLNFLKFFKNRITVGDLCLLGADHRLWYDFVVFKIGFVLLVFRDFMIFLKIDRYCQGGKIGQFYFRSGWQN